MSQLVDVPTYSGTTTIEFPDGMSKADIGDAIRRNATRIGIPSPTQRQQSEYVLPQEAPPPPAPTDLESTTAGPSAPQFTPPPAGVMAPHAAPVQGQPVALPPQPVSTTAGQPAPGPYVGSPDNDPFSYALQVSPVGALARLITGDKEAPVEPEHSTAAGRLGQAALNAAVAAPAYIAMAAPAALAAPVVGTVGAAALGGAAAFGGAQGLETAAQGGSAEDIAANVAGGAAIGGVTGGAGGVLMKGALAPFAKWVASTAVGAGVQTAGQELFGAEEYLRKNRKDLSGQTPDEIWKAVKENSRGLSGMTEDLVKNLILVGGMEAVPAIREARKIVSERKAMAADQAPQAEGPQEPLSAPTNIPVSESIPRASNGLPANELPPSEMANPRTPETAIPTPETMQAAPTQPTGRQWERLVNAAKKEYSGQTPEELQGLLDSGKLSPARSEAVQRLIQETAATKPVEAQQPTPAETLPSQGEESAPSSEPSFDGVSVRSVPGNEIAVRPRLMQFKQSDSLETGTNKTDQIDGKWDPYKAGNILLWEPEDPKAHGLEGDQRYIVANGHHRFEFGQRQGVPEYNAQVVRETDGFSANDARRLGAEINIADGKGTIYDQAKFIRNISTTHGPDEALAAAGRIGAKGRKASDIGNLAEDNLFTSFFNEQITPDQAAAIAAAAPHDDAAQQLGIRQALKGSGPQELSNFVKAVRLESQSQGDFAQGDLFGNNDSAIEEMQRRAGIATSEQRRLREQIAAVQGAAKRPDTARGLGVDVQDPEGLQKRIGELKSQAAKWEDWPQHPDLVAKVKGIESGEVAPASNANDNPNQADLFARGTSANASMPPPREPNDITRVTKPLFQTDSVHALRQKTRFWAKDNLQGKVFKNKETGWGIEVSKIGVDHATKGRGNLADHFHSVPSIPELIERGKLIESRPPKEGVSKLKQIHIFEAPIEVMGRRYTAKLTVKESVEGRKFYDHSLTAMKEEPRLSARVTSDEHSLDHGRPKGSLDASVEQTSEKDKGTSSNAALSGIQYPSFPKAAPQAGAAARVPLPGIVRLIKEMTGKVAFVRPNIGGSKLGVFRARAGGEGEVRARADIFKGPEIETVHTKTRPTASDLDQYRQDIAKRENILPDDVLTEVNLNRKTRRFDVTAYKRDHDYAAGILAHELGHAEDFKPGETLKRGNLLGRVAKLVKYNSGTLGFYSDSTIRQELKDLTQWWNPFTPGKNKYTKYRFSGKELYADAWSVMLNDPQELERRAPTFYKALNDYMDARPQMKAEYDAIQSDLHAGETPATWLAQDRAMMERADVVREGVAKAREERTKVTAKNAIQSMNKFFVDNRAALPNTGLPSENPTIVSEGLVYSSSSIGANLGDINREVFIPLAKAGISEGDVNIYMLRRRAATERADIANPGGIRGADAVSVLDALKQDVGPAKYQAIEDAVAKFWEIRKKEVFPVLERSGLFTPDQMAMIMDNENYATFQVQRHIEDSFGKGASARLFRQQGTLEDVDKPLTATMQKDIALMQAAHVNEAKATTALNLRKYDPLRIQDAPRRWDGQKMGFGDPKDPEQALMLYKENGEQRGVHIPKDMVEWFDKDPVAFRGAAMWFSAMNALPRMLYTGRLAPGFAFANVQKDFWGSFRNVGRGLLAAPSLAASTIAASREAFLDGMWDKPTPFVREMYRRNELIHGRQYRVLEADSGQTEAERLVKSFHKMLGKEPSKIRLLDPDRWNQVSERMAKIAGKRYLIKSGQYAELVAEMGQGNADLQMSHVVRTQVGSPAFLLGGSGRILVNNLALYSNAGTQAYRASWEAFRTNPVGYMMRTAISVIAPKAILYAMTNKLGDYLYAKTFGGDPNKKSWMREVLEGVPDFDMRNYHVIPLGLTPGGKSVYAVFQTDHIGQMVGATVWDMLDAQYGTAATNVAKDLAQQNPFDESSNAPLLEVLSDWYQYVIGKPPHDTWHGEAKIPEQVFKAGGPRAWKALAKSEWNDIVGSSVGYRFKGESEAQIQDEWEKLANVPGLSSITRRMIRVSDKGKADAIRVVQDAQGVLSAERSVSIKEYIDAKVSTLPQGATRMEATRAALQAYRDAPKDLFQVRSIVDTGKRYKPYSASDFRQRFVDAWTMKNGTAQERAKAAATSRVQKDVAGSVAAGQ